MTKLFIRVREIQKRFPVLFFILTFLLTFFAFYRILYSKLFSEFLHPKIIYATGYLPHKLLYLFGESTNFTSGRFIHSSRLSLEIIIDCCSLEPIILFIAVATAFPAPLKKKLIGSLLIVPVFYVINVIRIITIYYAGAYGNQSLMGRLHLDIWQILLIIFSIAFSFSWIRWTMPGNIKKEGA